MRNSRVERGPQTFRFTPELGERLRELRERAGLSLVELCHVMGRRPGYQAYLGRLEAGRVPFPSLALVADFLRACRASFADLLPLMNEYTSRPPVRPTRIEERVEFELAGLPGREAHRLAKYDLKRGEQLMPDARVRAASRQARAARERRLLEAMMMREVNRLGVEPNLLVRLVAHGYARMVWKAMRLTEGAGREGEESEGEGKERSRKPGVDRRRGRPRKTREQRLEEARARILEVAPDILPAKVLDHIRDKVVRLFEDVRRFEGSRAEPG